MGYRVRSATSRAAVEEPAQDSMSEAVGSRGEEPACGGVRLRTHQSRPVTLLLLLLFLLRLHLVVRRLCNRCTTSANGLVADIPRDAVATGHDLLTRTAIGLIVKDVAADHDSGRIEGFDLHTIKDTANRGCRMVARHVRGRLAMGPATHPFSASWTSPRSGPFGRAEIGYSGERHRDMATGASKSGKSDCRA